MIAGRIRALGRLAKPLNPQDITSYSQQGPDAEVKWYDRFSCGQVFIAFALGLHRIPGIFPAN
jgi:hypothetical protein